MRLVFSGEIYVQAAFE